jgi:phosphate starvation-inducible PhoH-like protein
MHPDPQPHLNTAANFSDIVLEPADNRRLANLSGQFDEHLRQIERRLGVEINNRGNVFRVIGEQRSVQAAGELLRDLYRTTDIEILNPSRINLYLQEAGVDALLEEAALAHEEVSIKTKRGVIRGRGPHQISYLRAIQEQDICFGIGPAGTGKTYLAVASAVDAMERDKIRRLILTRPAVETGERLGFLPGDLSQKIDPYLRPLYDALYEMLGFEQVARLIERNVIEVAPLAYMRGRTLNDSFIILDEAQNTTVEQMKMFLTRIGFSSKAVITGDITQIDLPVGRPSGLIEAKNILQDIKGIKMVFFSKKDVVRHKLVQEIINAYEQLEADRTK